MTLPKSGRRQIKIENELYFWTAKSEFRANGANSFVETRLVVERAEHRGQLRATFDSRALFPAVNREKYADYLAITPAVVRAAIIYALENGWLKSKNDFVIENAAARFEDVLRRAAEIADKWNPPQRVND